MVDSNESINLSITDDVIVDQETGEIKFSKEEFIRQVREVTTTTDIYSEDLTKDGVGSRRRENGLKNIIEKFKSKRRWDAFFDYPPLGYEYNEEGWIQINPTEATKVRFLFQTFLDAPPEKAYSYTCEKFVERHGTPRIEIAHPNQVKQNLKRPVYIGQPTVNTTPPNETAQIELSNQCPELQLISTSTFEDVQAKIESITENFNSEYDIRSIDHYIKKFNEEVFVQHCESAKITNGEVKIHCPDCDSMMALTGGDKQKQLPEGTRMGRYYCSDCEKGIVRPKQSELLNIHKDIEQTH